MNSKCLGKVIHYIKSLFYLLVFFLVVLQNNLINAQCNAINFTTSITSDYNGDDVSCPNACDGEITNVTSLADHLDIKSITKTILQEIQLSKPPIFSNLCQGDYDVTVTDTSQLVIPGIFWCNSSNGQTLKPFLLCSKLWVSTANMC